jgi:glycosyltransferase involved in cell wall biosynthesis
MPSAVESFDLSEFDTVISSSVSFSKGIVLKPKTKHICYCYSPTRFLWDRNADYEHSGIFSRISRHFLRIWDRQAGDRVDQFVATSENVRRRIKKYYNKDSVIIHPPISLTSNNYMLHAKHFSLTDYYLIVSRLHDFKNIHLAIDVFNKLNLPLIIIGDGPAKGKLNKMADKNIKLIGYQNDETVIAYYKHCRAFIMPQEEDFGLTPIEAMSFGKPVLALRKGGALETISEGMTGEFFDDPIPEALADGIRRLNENYEKYNAESIKLTAEKFSREKFRNEILKLVNS